MYHCDIIFSITLKKSAYVVNSWTQSNAVTMLRVADKSIYDQMQQLHYVTCFYLGYVFSRAAYFWDTFP